MERPGLGTRARHGGAVLEVGMSVGAGDGARLRRIEDGLARDDPSLVAHFRSWRSPDGPPPGWSVLPPWVAAVFLFAMTTWMLGPVVGSVVGGALGLQWLRKRSAARAVRPGGRGSSRRRR
jgi:hypothetical protein